MSLVHNELIGMNTVYVKVNQPNDIYSFSHHSKSFFNYMQIHSLDNRKLNQSAMLWFDMILSYFVLLFGEAVHNGLIIGNLYISYFIFIVGITVQCIIINNF